jgi:TDG/mug DNA glycosylase family protein
VVVKPTREELEAAVGRTIPDVIGPRLKVLFCGINPGLWSGATGYHFAHPGNRFWNALHASGFTQERLQPDDERRLLAAGAGITNIVDVTTRTAAELDARQLEQGAEELERKVREHQPQTVAFLGLGAYRTAFGRKNAEIGRQQETIAHAPVWVLPNPSGLQAHYPFERLVEELAALRRACEHPEHG